MSYVWLVRGLHAGQAAVFCAAVWIGVTSWKNFPQQDVPPGIVKVSTTGLPEHSLISESTQDRELFGAFEQYASAFTRQVFVRPPVPKESPAPREMPLAKPFLPPAWKLKGVVGGDVPRAVILTERGALFTVAEGERLQDGVVASIFPNRVGIRMGEDRFELSL